MRDNDVREGRLPKLVVDAIEAFVDDLHGRPSTFDLEALDDETRAIVEELLPDVAAAVLSGGSAALDDVPGWEGSTVFVDLGLVTVPGMMRLNGAAVRRHRERQGLSTAEVAAAVTSSGHTLMPSFVDDVEGKPGTAVSPALATKVAGALGVEVADVTFGDSLPDAVGDGDASTAAVEGTVTSSAVVADSSSSAVMAPPLGLVDTRVDQLVHAIRFVRPDLTVKIDVAPAAGRPSLVALNVGRFGLVTIVLLFDGDAAALWDREVLDAAHAVFASQPETLVVFLAAADLEYSTQPVDRDDLSAAVVTTSGQKLVFPRRPVLGIGDAIWSTFEELLPVWDDVHIPVATTSTVDVADVAARHATAALAATVAARVRIPAKTKALEVIAAKQAVLVGTLAGAAAAVRNHHLDPAAVAETLVAELPVAS